MRLLSSPNPARVAAYAAIALVLFVVTWLIPAMGWLDVPALPIGEGATVEATVLEVREVRTPPSPPGIRREIVTVRVGDVVAEIEQVLREDDLASLRLERGDGVLLTAVETAEGTRYFVRDRERKTPVWTLALVFAAFVVLVGGWRGTWSLIGLIASFAIILRFIVPAILAGGDPVTVAIVGSMLVMFATLTLAHGINWTTFTALAGTAVSLLVTGALAALSIRAAQLSGISEDHAASLFVLTGGAIAPQGLLLAGIIIGALGVLDDVTETQASTVFELRRAAPRLGLAELYARAMNVGREHIAATVNTLMLAYAGAALPLLMLLASQSEPPGILISYDALATEAIRTLAGSIGIVSAVPVTTAIAAAVASRGLGVRRDGEPSGRAAEELLARRE